MNQRFNKIAHVSSTTTPNNFTYNISGVVPNNAKNIKVKLLKGYTSYNFEALDATNPTVYTPVIVEYLIHVVANFQYSNFTSSFANGIILGV